MKKRWDFSLDEQEGQQGVEGGGAKKYQNPSNCQAIRSFEVTCRGGQKYQEKKTIHKQKFDSKILRLSYGECLS